MLNLKHSNFFPQRTRKKTVAILNHEQEESMKEQNKELKEVMNAPKELKSMAEDIEDDIEKTKGKKIS